MIKIIETEYRHPITGEQLNEKHLVGPYVDLLDDIISNKIREGIVIDCYLSLTDTLNLSINSNSKEKYLEMMNIDSSNSIEDDVNKVCKYLIHSLSTSGIDNIKTQEKVKDLEILLQFYAF